MRLCIGYAGSRHSSAVHKRCIGSAFRRRVEWEQGALRAFDTAVEGTGFEEIGALATVNSITFPRSRLLDRSDSPDSPYLQVRDDINTSAFCRTCIGDGNLSEVHRKLAEREMPSPLRCLEDRERSALRIRHHGHAADIFNLHGRHVEFRAETLRLLCNRIAIRHLQVDLPV